MVSILTVGKVVCTEVRATHDNLVINAIEFHMLQTPAFIDALGNKPLAKAGQIGCVKHANLDPGTELGDERGKERGT